MWAAILSPLVVWPTVVLPAMRKAAEAQVDNLKEQFELMAMLAKIPGDQK